MNVRIKSYSTMSDALTDQALLNDNQIEAQIENSHDIHPTLLGQVFLSVKKDDAVEAVKILNKPLFEPGV